MYKIRVEPGLLIRSLAISQCCSAMSGGKMFANKEMEWVENEEFVAYKSRTKDFRWRDWGESSRTADRLFQARTRDLQNIQHECRIAYIIRRFTSMSDLTATISISSNTIFRSTLNANHIFTLICCKSYRGVRSHKLWELWVTHFVWPSRDIPTLQCVKSTIYRPLHYFLYCLPIIIHSSSI